MSARNAGPPDIDLLIVVDDSSLDEHAAPGHLAGVPGTLALASDTRHNAPRGGRPSASSTSLGHRMSCAGCGLRSSRSRESTSLAAHRIRPG
ncbi:MAG: hypothetical protein ABSA93_39140 [Streptosporangiaceae bacterium]